MRKDKSKLWFIILNYNNYVDTLSCIKSIQDSSDKRYEIVIIDNNSNDNSGYLLKKQFPSYNCIILPANRGYAAGNNAGIKFAIDHEAEYICILNNDVIVPADFVSKALVAMKNSNLDVIAPIICEFDHPKVIQSAGAMIDLNFGTGRFLHYGEDPDNVDLTIDTPDYLGGACFIARRDVFFKLGMIPEFYFLFYEETDWFFSARRKGVRFACDDNMKIYHKGSASVDQVYGLSKYYMTRNQVIFERRKATKLQFMTFLLFSVCRWLYHLVRNRKIVFSLKAFWDGLMFNIPKEGAE